MAVNKFCKSCRPSTFRRSPNSLSPSLYSLRTHPTISLFSSIRDNFFFGAILSSTMHIYILASARNERQTEQIGFRQWHGRRWRGGSCKRGPRVCHRKHSHPLITQLKWTGNVPLVHTRRHVQCHHRHYRHRHRYYNYYYYYHRSHDITLLSQLHDCIRWCNS